MGVGAITGTYSWPCRPRTCAPVLTTALPRKGSAVGGRAVWAIMSRSTVNARICEAWLCFLTI